MAFSYQIKDKKNILTKLYFIHFYITRKFELQGSFVDKVSGSSIFPDPYPAPGDPKRPDRGKFLFSTSIHPPSTHWILNKLMTNF